MTAKTNTSVTFQLQNGKTATQAIRLLSAPDGEFVRKWTKFKDDLLRNAEFSSITLKDLLTMRGYQGFEYEIEGNHIFVEGELSGKPARFMIDTGASTTLIHDGAAKELGLEMGPYDQKIYGVAGSQDAAITKVPSLRVGDALIENRKILATDLFKAGSGGGRMKQFDVIFGADFLRELDAVITYREGRIFLKPDNLKAPTGKPVEVKDEFRRWTNTEGKTFQGALVDKDDTKGTATFRLSDKRTAVLAYDKLDETSRESISKWSKLRDDLAKNPEFKTLTVKELLDLRKYQSFEYRLEGNHILVTGAVGKMKANFLVDTGAGGLSLHLGFSKIAGLEMGPMDQIISGIGGDAPACITKVPELTLGDVVIRDREGLSADIFKNDATASAGRGNHDALFGADFMRQLDAVINYKEGRMFLKPDLSDAAPSTGGEEKKEPEKAPK